MAFHHHDSINAVLNDIAVKMVMLRQMVSENRDHAADHEAFGFVKHDEKLLRQIERATTILLKCEAK